MMMIRTFSSSI